jgi:hypothetical protein
MQKINNIFNNQNSSSIIEKHQHENESQPNEDQASAEIVNWLFDRLRNIIPAFFINVTNQGHLNGIKRAWLEALQRHDVSSEEQLKLGLQSLVDSKATFLPPVMQFIEGCKPSPESLGIPPLERAYAQACKNSHPCETSKHWTHDIVYHAWIATGANNLSKLPRSSSHPMFERNYDILIKRLLDGCVLDSAPIPLGIEEHKPVTDGVGSSFLDKMKKQLGG